VSSSRVLSPRTDVAVGETASLTSPRSRKPAVPKATEIIKLAPKPTKVRDRPPGRSGVASSRSS
jgi:hypothetical protein